MKIANVNGRAALVLEQGIADIATSSDGRFGPDPITIFDRWADVALWASSVTDPTGPLIESELRCPIPDPRQVFAIGLNYRTHAEESGMPIPTVPATFTKFPASLTGPFNNVELVGESTDWEVELVAVIGTHCDHVDPSRGWDHIAGLTIGQDISDRHLQFAAGSQFSLGKSRRSYGPMGPWIVTPDEFSDPDDIALRCFIDGELMQDARSSDLIFGVPQLVAELSAILPLYPGDVIFTGTPSGVGAVRTPPIFLKPGQVIESWIDGIGTMRNTCI